MASTSACASTAKENNASNNNFETHLVEFMYDKLVRGTVQSVREAVKKDLWDISGGKEALSNSLSNDNIIHTLTTRSLLETYPFDGPQVESLKKSILESKANLEKGDGSVSFWVLKEFDVVERDGNSILILKNDDPSTPTKEVIGCNETFKLIKDAHLNNNHAGFNELEGMLMSKYFFHRFCIVSFLKLCSVCNKDPDKVPADILLPKTPVHYMDDRKTPMESVILKPIDTNNYETPIENVILNPTNPINAYKFEIPIENIMSIDPTNAYNSEEPVENVIVKPKSYPTKTYKPAYKGNTPLLTIKDFASLKPSPQPTFVKKTDENKKDKAENNFPQWSMPPEVSEQAQIPKKYDKIKCEVKNTTDKIMPLEVPVVPPTKNVANKQATPAPVKLTRTATLVLESAPSTSITQDAPPFVQPLPNKFILSACNVPTTAFVDTPSSLLVETSSKPYPVPPKSVPNPTLNIKQAPSIYTFSKTKLANLETRFATKTHKSSEAVKRKPSKKLEEFKKILMPPPSKKAKSQLSTTSLVTSDRKFSVCRAEVMPFKDVTEESEYKALLMYLDTYSKYVLLKPLRSKNIDEVTEELYRIFADFGPPEVIQTHLYQRTLFDVIRKVMKQGPVGATYTVEVSKTMRSIISEQILLLIEKWSSVTNCKDMFIASLEIQKQLNSFMSTNNKLNTNPFHSMFGSRRAPYKNFNQHFSMVALLECEDKLATDGKSHEDIAKASSSKTQSLLISSDFTASDSFPKITDVWSEANKVDDDDEPIIIEQKVEVIDLSDDENEEQGTFEELKFVEGGLVTQFENFFPSPIKTENSRMFARQSEEKQNTSKVINNLLKISDAQVFNDPKLTAAQPFVVLERCDHVVARINSKRKRKWKCHECGKPVQVPVFCQDCSRPVHFNWQCSRDRNILEDDGRVSCKTCVKIQEKLDMIEFELILPDEYKKLKK